MTGQILPSNQAVFKILKVWSAEVAKWFFNLKWRWCKFAPTWAFRQKWTLYPVHRLEQQPKLVRDSQWPGENPSGSPRLKCCSLFPSAQQRFDTQSFIISKMSSNFLMVMLFSNLLKCKSSIDDLIDWVQESWFEKKIFGIRNSLEYRFWANERIEPIDLSLKIKFIDDFYIKHC